MSKLIEYKHKENDREVSWGISNHAAPVMICLVLALLVVSLILLGVSPADVWRILSNVKWR